MFEGSGDFSSSEPTLNRVALLSDGAERAVSTFGLCPNWQGFMKVTSKEDRQSGSKESARPNFSITPVRNIPEPSSATMHRSLCGPSGHEACLGGSCSRWSHVSPASPNSSKDNGVGNENLEAGGRRSDHGVIVP
jgi:hypothetical protein